MSYVNGTADGIPLKPQKDHTGGTTTAEDVALVERQRRVSVDTACRLRTVTLVISWISVVYLGIMGVATLVLAFLNNNSSSFAFALDALLDAASSTVLIWRYSGSAASLYSAKREKTACITLGVLFICSFISICARSSYSLANHIHPKRSRAVWIMSLANTLVCAAFFVIKAYLARKLESVSIATDAVNSGIGFVVSLSTVLSDLAYDEHMSVWYMDPIIGIICAVFLLVYGIWVIVYEVRINTEESHDK